MHINVQLKHEKGNTEARVLIDSRAEGLLIDKQFCKKKGIQLKKIDTPIPVDEHAPTLGSGKGIRKALGTGRPALDEYQGCRLLPNTVGPYPTD